MVYTQLLRLKSEAVGAFYLSPLDGQVWIVSSATMSVARMSVCKCSLMGSLITFWLDLSAGRAIADMGGGRGRVQVVFVWTRISPTLHDLPKFT